MKMDYPVRRLCLYLNASPSGFYDWEQRQVRPCARALENQSLSREIDRIQPDADFFRLLFPCDCLRNELYLAPRFINAKRELSVFRQGAFVPAADSQNCLFPYNKVGAWQDCDIKQI